MKGTKNMTYNITIPGPPVGKGRPRFVSRGKFVQTYTPEKTAVYENLVKLAWQEAGHPMLEGELFAVIGAYFPIPKSASKKERAQMEAGLVGHTHKPDADNVAKCVLDALNGVAYQDDAAITHLSIVKAYSATPRCEVYFMEGPR